MFVTLVPKNDNYIAINTYPDFDDTARSLLDTLEGTGKSCFLILRDKPSQKPEWAFRPHVRIAHRFSFYGAWLYFRSRYVFFTHGLYSFCKPKQTQIVMNLWHGMPIKNIGYLDGKDSDNVVGAHYAIADNSFFQKVMAEAFGLPENRVFASLHPRLEGMLIKPDLTKLGIPAGRPVCLWLPTYRQSHVGDIRMDGNADGDVFSDAFDMISINAILKENDCYCLIKPHPMARADKQKFESLSHMIYVDEDVMTSHKTTLYQLLGQADFLITDVSSVYFDFKNTNRPCLMFCPDFEEYQSGRGFVAPLETFVRDPILKNKAELEEALRKQCKIQIVDKESDLAPIRGITKKLLQRLGVLSG